MGFRIWSICLLVCVAGALQGSDFLLVEGGKAHCRIQGSPAPSPLEFRAAMELQTYLEKITGAHVMRNTSNGNIRRVFLGEDLDVVEIMPVLLENGRRLLPGRTVSRLESSRSRESFHIVSVDSPKRGKSIFIAGKTPISVLYGTYAFIEDHLGVRFFHAGPEGEFCPRKETIRLGDLDDFREPWLRGRFLNCWEGSVAPWGMDRMREWLTRRTFLWNINHNYDDLDWETLAGSLAGNCVPGGGGHLTYETAIPQALFKTHPEFFPLQGGRRVCKPRSQRCFSNPEVRRRIIDHICWHTDYTPSYSIGFHDSTDGWCECPECIRYGTDKDGRYSLSNVAHRLMNEVAAAVLKHNPGVELVGDCYSDYREPPTAEIPFVDGLVYCFCPHQRCYVHPFDDRASDCNSHLFGLFEKWRAIHPRMGIFDYYSYSDSPYCPLEYTLAKDMRYYHRIGLDAWTEDCTNKDLPIPASNWQFYYIASKLAWNAELDLDRLLDDMYTRYYGSAAAPMKKYHALRRELWESAPGHALYGGGRRYGSCLLVEGAEKRLLGYLGQAERLAAADPMVTRRLALDRGFLTRFWIAEARRVRASLGASGRIPIARRSTPVAVDGVLDEEAWRPARLVTPFRTVAEEGGKEPVEETRVRILHDDQAWYLGVEAMMEHAWGRPRMAVWERDGQVWKDDSVEVFIAPPGADYYHLIVNPAGALYDSRGRDPRVDVGAEVRVRLLQDRYVVEMRVPAAGLGREGIRCGESWQFHFCRSCRNLQPPRTDEYSSLGGVAPHDQGMFRFASVGTDVIRNGDFSLKEKVTGEERKRLAGEFFPRHWGGSGAAMAVSPDGRNMIELRDVAWSYFRLPKNGRRIRLSGSVLASGPGRLEVSMTGCVRPRGDRRPFGHEIRRVLGVFDLKESPEFLPIVFDADADGEYYIQLRSSGGPGSRAVVRGVSLSY